MSLEKYNEAVHLIKRKRYKDAMFILAELLTSKEPYEKIHYNLAICYLNSGYANDAAEEFELSLDENLTLDEKINTLTLLGYLNSKLKEYKKAIKYLKKSLKYEKNNTKAYSCLGYCYYAEENFEKAIENYKKGLELDKENANLKNSLGFTILESGGDVNEAMTYIKTALRKEPKKASYLDSLAWAHYKSNRFATALDTIVEAKTLDPDNEIINKHYKEIFEKIK